MQEISSGIEMGVDAAWNRKAGSGLPAHPSFIRTAVLARPGSGGLLVPLSSQLRGGGWLDVLAPAHLSATQGPGPARDRCAGCWRPLCPPVGKRRDWAALLREPEAPGSLALLPTWRGGLLCRAPALNEREPADNLTLRLGLCSFLADEL